MQRKKSHKTIIKSNQTLSNKNYGLICCHLQAVPVAIPERRACKKDKSSVLFKYRYLNHTMLPVLRQIIKDSYCWTNNFMLQTVTGSPHNFRFQRFTSTLNGLFTLIKLPSPINNSSNPQSLPKAVQLFAPAQLHVL